MGFLLGLNMILWIGGFLMPLPFFILSCRESISAGNIPPAKIWRRRISQFSLLLLGVGLALWVYAVLRNWWGYNLYDSLTADYRPVGLCRPDRSMRTCREAG